MDISFIGNGVFMIIEIHVQKLATVSVACNASEAQNSANMSERPMLSAAISAPIACPVVFMPTTSDPACRACEQPGSKSQTHSGRMPPPMSKAERAAAAADKLEAAGFGKRGVGGGFATAGKATGASLGTAGSSSAGAGAPAQATRSWAQMAAGPPKPAVAVKPQPQAQQSRAGSGRVAPAAPATKEEVKEQLTLLVLQGEP